MPSLSSEMGSESQASQMLRLVTEDDSSSGSAFSKQNDASDLQSSNDIPESVPIEDVAPQFYLYGLGESQSQRQGDDSFAEGSQKENLGSSGSGPSSSQGGSQVGTLAEARVNAPAPAKARADMAPPLLIVRVTFKRQWYLTLTAFFFQTSSKSPQPST
ncbi:uncharacterized protein SCHCODRAFT_02560450, partial [Schizophyllum commune H4-8]|uniref:uncharacterized protein n=1 Tax=Schizophyllum commune (strain H4-8 / FGSC 9210) TaxID=578458 RepID=UPI00215FFFD5